MDGRPSPREFPWLFKIGTRMPPPPLIRCPFPPNILIFFFPRSLGTSRVIFHPSQDVFHARVLLNDPFDFLGQMSALINIIPIVLVKIAVYITRRSLRTSITFPRSLKMSLFSDFLENLFTFSVMYVANWPRSSVGWARVDRAMGLSVRAFHWRWRARLGS